MTEILGRTALYLSEFTEVSILTKATITVSLMLLAARLARRARASERHVLLAATFAILLVLPVLTLLMPAIPVAVSTAAAGDARMSALAWSVLPMESDGERAPRSVSQARRSSSLSLLTILRTTWALGVLCFVGPVAFALWRLRCALRCGLPWPKGEDIVRNVAPRAGLRRSVDVLLHEGVAVPMTCGFIRPSIVFPLDVERWHTACARRAIVHELEHVRRGDWPIQLAARIVVSLYWFHPLVWRAWGQLCLESERACDDAVLRHGEGTDYAQQLVTMAGRFANARVRPVLSMAKRSDLATRIRAILDADQRRGEARGLRVTAAIVSALMLALAIAPLRATNDRQSSASVSNGPRFEVAAVKVNVSGDLRANISTSPGGRFTARNVPLRVLIRRAYQLQEFQLEGGPRWLDHDRFDVIAQGEANATPQHTRLMLQSLLADRFNLNLHSEMRDVSLYALVMSRRDGRLGPALRRSEADCSHAASIWDGLGPSGPSDPDAQCGVFGPASGGAAKFRGVTLEALARFLSTPVRRPVIDRTGLTGYFDADLEMTAEIGPPPPPPGVPDQFDRSAAPSIFTVLQQQLGLKLEAEKGPIAVFVIDSLEHPTTTSPPSDAGLTFEVATIKPNNSGSNGRRFGFPGDRFEATNGTLRELIALAFGQPGPPPQPIPNYRISGGPNWMNSDRFDVMAKAADNMTGSTGARTKQLRLRTLLAQRFKLSLHNETKEGPIYALVLARRDRKLGPQLHRSELDCTALKASRRNAPGFAGGPDPCGSGVSFLGSLKGGAMTMGDLSFTLSMLVDRVVLDRTGLTGAFDVELQFTPEGLPGLPGPPGVERPPSESPSIFTAVQEQLGLKLEARKGPIEYIVIDYAEHPVED